MKSLKMLKIFSSTSELDSPSSLLILQIIKAKEITKKIEREWELTIKNKITKNNAVLVKEHPKKFKFKQHQRCIQKPTKYQKPNRKKKKNNINSQQIVKKIRE